MSGLGSTVQDLQLELMRGSLAQFKSCGLLKTRSTFKKKTQLNKSQGGWNIITEHLNKLYYLLQKYITKNENSSFIDKKRTNYCSIMDQHLVWYPLASMTAAILRGMDSQRELRYSGGNLSPDLLFKPLLFQI